MGGLAPWGCGVESVGGEDTWNYFLHHGGGVETAGGGDTWTLLLGVESVGGDT